MKLQMPNVEKNICKNLRDPLKCGDALIPIATREILVCQFSKIKISVLGAKFRSPLLGKQSSQESSLDPSAGPVGAVCLLILDPDQVDYLNLKINERLTFTSSLSIDGEKFRNSERINP